MDLSKERASVSDPAPPRWKYDVFLSFRGKDTRKTFTDHLYNNLVRQAIRTFRDNSGIERGTNISSTLSTAVEESQFAIIVLSPNYASSTWCLDELVHILKCVEVRNAIIPILYGVEPSLVREQKGTFEAAFDEHERNFSEDMRKLQEWRRALEKVSVIAGMKSDDYSYETELINQIVKIVSNRVHPTFKLLGSAKKMAGIDFRPKKLHFLLDLEANDVRFIGIFGEAGIGKTFTARQFYDEFSHYFEVSCFLADVGKVSATYGLIHLQSQLLSSVLKTNTQVVDDYAGTVMTKKCFNNKKVLLVLDGVDQLGQLARVAGNKNWFGLGSRIIVTTRDERLLEEHDHELYDEFAEGLPESLNLDSRPPCVNNDGFRVCAGCNRNIERGRYLECIGAFWHPECFVCITCKLPITDHEFSVSEDSPYHVSCYKAQHFPNCDVCKTLIPIRKSDGLIEYRQHPFWLQKYCPSHERDGTPRCYSCERMEPWATKYFLLPDGRKQCSECNDSEIMDDHKCNSLFLQVQAFFEDLDMKFEQQIPVILVGRRTLNKDTKVERLGHHYLPETRAVFSAEPIVTSILRMLKGHSRITSIRMLYGLPRLLSGSILAALMMHAWLRLNGYRNLSPEVGYGIYQVLAHTWLDSETSSGSSSTMSNEGKKLGEFFKYSIETNTTIYGQGFRAGNQAVLKHGLRRTLDHIRTTGAFPIDL
ncbi:hypothetical protein FF1_002512 [Malus domestica]|uniref:LIM domain-containing protein HDR3-like n=1 Tax=Malus domestica TaxID=3750 RepID=UPI0010AAF072|nr:uncharacterized protein LOC103436981 [Malus domestica]